MMKRLFDITFSLIILLPLSLPLIIIMLMIRIRLGAPVFFKQTRPGLNSKPFKMIKFRTMTNEVGLDGELLPDAARLTPFGKALRASSVDELPELWNVLMGDMSLVGPRPLLMRYIPLYSSEQARRHNVRPGITGWAQVNGRNAISWEAKFLYDVWYVDNHNLWLDMKILYLTVLRVVMRKDISAKEEETMGEFFGSSSFDPENR
ncbi:sugar transferase [Polynucleobacter paneuropaeus]|nr:sugar transferase [Polynucleobacter paneuropaeus]